MVEKASTRANKIITLLDFEGKPKSGQKVRIKMEDNTLSPEVYTNVRGIAVVPVEKSGKYTLIINDQEDESYRGEIVWAETVTFDEIDAITQEIHSHIEQRLEKESIETILSNSTVNVPSSSLLRSVKEELDTKLTTTKSTLEAAQQSHAAHLENPHQTTKKHVGLEHVTNDAQLKQSQFTQNIGDLSPETKVPSLKAVNDGLSLKANQSELDTLSSKVSGIESSVGDRKLSSFEEDKDHRLVTDAQMSLWNAKVTSSELNTVKTALQTAIDDKAGAIKDMTDLDTTSKVDKSLLMYSDAMKKYTHAVGISDEMIINSFRITSFSNVPSVNKKGSSVPNVTVSWNTNYPATEGTLNGVSLTAEELNAKKKVFADVTADTTYSLYLKQANTPHSVDNHSSSTTCYFVDPMFVGTMAGNQSGTSGLTEHVQRRSTMHSSVNLANNRAVFKYPASYGALESIIQDDVTPVLGAFEYRIEDINGVNYMSYQLNGDNSGTFKFSYKFPSSVQPILM